MNFQFRFGQQSDTPEIVRLVREVGGGVFETLFDQLVPGIQTADFLEMAIRSPESPLHFSNAILAHDERQVIGMALAYSAAQFEVHPALKSIVPAERLAPLESLFSKRIEDSWYLNTLFVDEQARQQGLGRFLVELCGDVAAENGFSSLSLHVWADNAPARRLYSHLGFKVHSQIPLELPNRPPREGGMLLMQAPFPLQKADYSEV